MLQTKTGCPGPNLAGRAAGCVSQVRDTMSAAMSVLLVHSERFVEHQTPPGHPERPERAEVLDAVANRWRNRGLENVAPREATHEQLARVHDEDYLRLIASTRGRAVKLDPDTY